MQASAAIVRHIGPRGALSAKLIPARDPETKPRFAPAWQPLPSGLSAKRYIRSLGKELGLRLRVSAKGAVRGLVAGTGVFGVARLYATKFVCACGSPGAHRGEVCPSARVEKLGLVSTKLVTDAGVSFLVDDWNNNAADLTTLNFHGCGTGTTAEAVGDTALVTESTTALNPDSTRATGTRSKPAGNQYRTVGTATFDASAAITEHGIFSQAATGGGTLWDRSVFSAINVATGDSIQFTYTCTVSSGG
jgi:hypothetical protein